MKRIIIVLVLLFSINLVFAQTSIDISGLKNEDYSIGEDLSYVVILLEDGVKITQDVEVTIKDALNKKEIKKSISSNSQDFIVIESNFPGGLWTIKATYQDAEVERTFLIGENAEVEFLIEEDELIIRNKGNVRYTKTVQIKIGTETNSYVQNIGVGEEKKLKLISPEGFYNIEVTDGKTSIKRQNIQLFGTGNVIGAVDTELVGYTGFAGVTNPTNPEDQSTSLGRLPLALVFVAAVTILGGLVLVERKISKKKKNMG